ncbi:MAG: glutaredoxin family protein [Marinicellaceae bacterium]
MFIIRKILGSMILFFNWLFSPRGIKRDAQSQNTINQQTEKLKLYQFHACPFCVKVRRLMKKLTLNIELRDAKNNPEFRAELESEGGRIKVPCLKIEDKDGSVKWLYESSDINAYLSQKFGSQ